MSRKTLERAAEVAIARGEAAPAPLDEMVASLEQLADMRRAADLLRRIIDHREIPTETVREMRARFGTHLEMMSWSPERRRGFLIALEDLLRQCDQVARTKRAVLGTDGAAMAKESTDGE